MGTIRKKSLNRKRKLFEGQEEHLIEGIALDCLFPFKNEAERRKLYFDNKQYLIDRTKDVRRIEDHYFFTKERELPQAYFDYEDERGIKKYSRRTKSWVKMSHPSRVTQIEKESSIISQDSTNINNLYPSIEL